MTDEASPPSRSLAESPDSPALADGAAALRSAYVHIPFCGRRCPYCDFAVVTPAEGGDDAAADRYVAALLDEIDMEETWGPLDAVNFGGGTPTRLTPAALQSILTALDRRFEISPSAEISVEANPEDWSDAYATGLVAAGFNRVSFGAQSFDPGVLSALGRTHSVDQVITAVASSRSNGFASVNLDLIFGTPGESMESWRRTVERALELEPDHLSAYGLTVELGTAFSRSIRAGGAAPDPDDQADKYEVLEGIAPTAGLVRYEISNYAGRGHHCRYNLSTWASGEYLGFGLGAHDHRDGVRSRNLRRLDAYLAAVERGDRPRAGSERLTGFRADTERLMLGLRRVAGVVPGTSGSRLLASSEGERLLEAGVLGSAGGRIRVLRPLLTDEVNRTVLSLSTGDC
jgi:oxygen-independent coproporphyrinogen-3 oxidase